MSNDKTKYQYDVAFSYASEDRAFADTLANALNIRGVNVFYDQYEKSNLWGQNLYTYLSDIYQNKARYCVMFFSQHYASKLWTNHERAAAQARAFEEQEVYILPIRLDDTEIPGFLKTVSYLNWHQETVEDITTILMQKLGKISSSLIPENLQRPELVWSIIERISKSTVRDAKFYSEKGDEFMRLGYNEDALVAYEQSLQLDPSEAHVWKGKGHTLWNIEHYDEALAAYKKALDLEPNKALKAYHYFDIAHVLSTLKRYDEALIAFDYAINLDPKNAYFLENKGYTLERMGRLSEAHQSFEKARKMGYNGPSFSSTYDPDNP